MNRITLYILGYRATLTNYQVSYYVALLEISLARIWNSPIAAWKQISRDLPELRALQEFWLSVYNTIFLPLQYLSPW